jgi:hypothetical protein
MTSSFVRPSSPEYARDGQLHALIAAALSDSSPIRLVDDERKVFAEHRRYRQFETVPEPRA